MDYYTPKDIAEELGITTKAFRAWLRTQTDDRAGRGGTWHIDEETKDELITRFRNKSPKGHAVIPVLKTDED